MIELVGRLRKLEVQATNPVSYALKLADGAGGAQLLELNQFLGRQVSISFSGNIFCIHCERATKKSFAQGYCYPCFRKLPQCDTCIVKPETCHYHLGTCRDPSWGEEHCLQPHVVYLANTTGLKVGITRVKNTPTRWIDQGAVAAVPLMEVPNRLASGQVETTFAQSIKDKTAWQRMLKNELEEINLTAEAQQALAQYQPELDLLELNEQFKSLDTQAIQEFNYPVLNYPTKVKALNLDKTPQVEGVLEGIKGQYLLLNTGVLNLRKFAGYEISVQIAN